MRIVRSRGIQGPSDFDAVSLEIRQHFGHVVDSVVDLKLEGLGLNHSVFFSATCHTVRPWSSDLSSVHLRIAPPQGSS